jgi:hypothetical protein
MLKQLLAHSLPDSLVDSLAWSMIAVAYASLVQLVERRSPKPNVGGSSPSGRAFRSQTLLKSSPCEKAYLLGRFAVYN